ncbi:MAG: hypothetical protein ACXVBW_11180, partial [Bdellovibrionota bacterium]
SNLNLKTETQIEETDLMKPTDLKSEAESVELEDGKLLYRATISFPEDLNLLDTHLKQIPAQPIPAGRKRAQIQFPVESTDETDAVFHLIPPSGGNIVIHIRPKLVASSDQFLVDSSCRHERIGMERVKPGGATRVFQIRCAETPSGDSEATVGELGEKEPKIFPVPLNLTSLGHPLGEFDEGRFSVFQRMTHWYARFRLSEATVIQASGGFVLSGEVSWNPEFIFSRFFGASLNLGGSLYTVTSGVGMFFVSEYEALLEYVQLFPFSIAVGGGAQSWWNHGGTYPTVTADVAWKFRRNFLWIVDRVFVNYTAYFAPADPAHEIRAGIGIGF